MLYADLDASALPTVDDEGRKLDFHAIRHTCATWLVERGAPLDVVQKHMRHSTITLTVNRYGKVTEDRRHEVLAQLPVLPDPRSNSLSLSLSLTDGEQRSAAESRGRISPRQEVRNPSEKQGGNAVSLGECGKPRVGLEPTTCGLQNRCSTN
jgi:hypothetical protein